MPLRLNLGSATPPIHPQHRAIMDTYGDGWVNIDLYVQHHEVVNHDATKLPYEPGSVDTIYTSHLLEHLGFKEVPQVLKHWYDLLRDGGEIVINVPDLAWACNVIAGMGTTSGYFTPDINYRRPDRSLLSVFFGNQDHEGEFHKSGFTQASLWELLEDTGFKKIVVNQQEEAHDMGCLIAKAVK